MIRVRFAAQQVTELGRIATVGRRSLAGQTRSICNAPRRVYTPRIPLSHGGYLGGTSPVNILNISQPRFVLTMI